MQAPLIPVAPGNRTKEAVAAIALIASAVTPTIVDTVLPSSWWGLSRVMVSMISGIIPSVVVPKKLNGVAVAGASGVVAILTALEAELIGVPLRAAVGDWPAAGILLGANTLIAGVCCACNYSKRLRPFIPVPVAQAVAVVFPHFLEQNLPVATAYEAA